MSLSVSWKRAQWLSGRIVSISTLCSSCRRARWVLSRIPWSPTLCGSCKRARCVLSRIRWSPSLCSSCKRARCVSSRIRWSPLLCSSCKRAPWVSSRIRWSPVLCPSCKWCFWILRRIHSNTPLCSSAKWWFRLKAGRSLTRNACYLLCVAAWPRYRLGAGGWGLDDCTRSEFNERWCWELDDNPWRGGLMLVSRRASAIGWRKDGTSDVAACWYCYISAWEESGITTNRGRN